MKAIKIIGIKKATSELKRVESNGSYGRVYCRLVRDGVCEVFVRECVSCNDGCYGWDGWDEILDYDSRYFPQIFNRPTMRDIKDAVDEWLCCM